MRYCVWALTTGRPVQITGLRHSRSGRSCFRSRRSSERPTPTTPWRQTLRRAGRRMSRRLSRRRRTGRGSMPRRRNNCARNKERTRGPAGGVLGAGPAAALGVASRELAPAVVPLGRRHHFERGHGHGAGSGYSGRSRSDVSQDYIFSTNH